MVESKLIKLEEQNDSTGFCLECRTGILMDKDSTKRVREENYEVVEDKYCGQCGNQLYQPKAHNR